MNDKEHYEKLRMLLDTQRERLKIGEPKIDYKLIGKDKETGEKRYKITGIHFIDLSLPKTEGGAIVSVILKPTYVPKELSTNRQYDILLVCTMGAGWWSGTYDGLIKAALHIKPYLDLFQITYYEQKLRLVFNVTLSYGNPENLVKDMDAIIQYFWKRIGTLYGVLKNEHSHPSDSISNDSMVSKSTVTLEHRRTYKVGQYSL